jgi:hypothetical protein
MGRYRRVVREGFTGLILVAVLVTTFLMGWTAAPAAVSAAPNPDTGTAADVSPAGSPATNTTAASGPDYTTSLVPMNTLILSEPGQADALAQAVTAAGDTVHVRQGDALFVGLDALSESDLTALGARALYHDRIPDAELTALAGVDYDAAQVWNAINDRAASTRPLNVSGTDDSVVLVPDNSASAAYAPSDTQTSSFLYGSVAVKVLFVESTSGTENWTETEVNKVKGEVVQALDWWTVAATVPGGPGDPARPSAQLTWDVSYVSPFDGDAADRAKINVNVEPITQSVYTAAANWIPQVAAAFVGGSGPSAVRALADNVRDTAGTDWGFVLYVVDSSGVPEGYFIDDHKAAGAALNGPWAVVTYGAGDLGTENLEVLIAKMVGHVFGAGDETYDELGGCYNAEIYGYLRVTHANCERAAAQLQPSLMRDGQDMYDAYQEFQLSESARQEVGWRDSDGDGVYDVVDTLRDSFTGLTAPPCPTLHLANVAINSVPALPDGIINPVGAQWGVRVWDPEANSGQGDYQNITLYTPVTINRPSFVWGRVNGGEWVQGAPSDGVWDEELESYTISLPGEAGIVNEVEIAIMDRWAQVSTMSDPPVEVSIAPAPAYVIAGNNLYESNDTSKVNLFDLAGQPGGWTDVAPPPPNGYSGNNTKLAVGVGSEACFAFSGIAVKILHSNESTGTANVYVDGELHSTITYTNTSEKQAVHYIAGLANGPHTVQIEAASGVIDFDAFIISDPILDYLIDALDTNDIPIPTPYGFYEQSGVKTLRAGNWNTVPLDTSKRPQPQPPPPSPVDMAGLRTTRPNDRLYFYVTNANIAAIYRQVFPGGGTAYVYVDGEFRGIMNNNAAYTAVMPFYIGGLDLTTPDHLGTPYHSIEVRVNPDAPSFTFDALRLLNYSPAQVYAVTTPGQTLDIPYNGAQETYGVWDYKSSGTYIQANDEGDLQNLFFQGSAVAVLVRTNSSGGIMELYVDGQLMRTLDLKVKSSKDAPVVLHGFDPSLPHVLQVRHHNANPARPKWSMIEGYRVYNIPPVTAGEYEEYNYDVSGNPTDSAFIYEETWKFPKPYTRTPGPSNQRYIQSSHPNARAYLYFTGVDTVRLYAAARSGYGTMEMWVDGKLMGEFKLTSGSTKWNVPYTVTGMNPEKVHVLELRIQNGKKSISIDKVELYNRPLLDPGTGVQRYENDGEVGGVPAIQISGQWTNIFDVNASGPPDHTTYDMAGSIQDQIVFDVKDATSVVLYRRLYSKYGMADVYVDGNYTLSFDNYVSTPRTGVFQQPFVISDLDPAFNHEIKIVPQPFGSKLNKYKPFDIDYIEVRSGDTGGANYLLPSAVRYEDNDPTALAGGAITYVGSSWTSNGDVTEALNKGEKAVVLFYGNAFTVYFNKARNGGKANISIDGQLIGTFNARAGSTVVDIPYSVGNLSEGQLHTAEINVQSGHIFIDAYHVQQLTPASGPTTFELNPTDSRILMSEEWTIDPVTGYLKTSEQGARLIMYVQGGDALFITHESWSKANNIEIYVNGQLYNRIDSSYLRKAPRPESTYILSGLTAMQNEGVWIELRDPKNSLISLKSIEVTSLTPGLAVDQAVEAEGSGVTPPPATDVIHRVGLWQIKPSSPDVRYSGGYYVQSLNQYAAFIIPTQEDVRYVTVYRNVGSFGDADVYIDGEFWGTMPNRARTTSLSMPFTIGPIPKTPGMHIVEIRQATRSKIVLDYVVGQGSNVLQPGTYENNDPRLSYTGKWVEFADSLASGGSLQKSTRSGDQLTATFTGNEISFIFRTTKSGSYMTAYIDGTPYPIATRTGATTYGVKHTILLTNGGPHSLVLTNTRGRIDLDAINIRSRAPAQYGAYQQDSQKVALNNGAAFWNVETAADNSGGSYVWTDDKYASAFLLFYGTRVTTYMTTGNDWGKMSFYVDGQLYEKVVQYVKKQLDTPFYAYDISGLPAGNHVLEVRFEGERNGRQGKKRANFDVFTVNGAPLPLPGDTPGPQPNAPRYGCYEETNKEWSLFGPDNAWTLRTNTGASGDQYYEATAWVDTYAQFHFAATGFGLVYHKSADGGMADVYVDGDLITTLDMSGNAWLSYYNYDGPALNPNVVHTVQVVHAGEGNVYFDRIDLPAYDAAFNDNCPNQ